MKRKILVIVGGLVVLCSVFFALSWQKINYILAAPRKESALTPKDLELIFEEMAIFVDGEKISVWFVPGESKVTIIFIPGWGGSKADFLCQKDGLSPAKELAKLGFSLCFFDPRGLGESEEKLFGLGYKENEDIKAIIDFLLAEGKAEKFILFGFSAGANAAIRVALERKEVIATIADSPFVNILHTKIYPKIVLYFFYFLSRLKLGWNWPETIDLSKRNLEVLNNVFLIAGEKDRTTPPEEAKFIFERAKELKELWIVPDSDHCQAFFVFPSEYLQRIISFLARALS